MRQGQILKENSESQTDATTPTPPPSGLLSSGEESSDGPFPYHVTLDPYGGFQLNWTVSPDKRKVTFHIHAQVSVDGTLALGFSDRGFFPNADLMFAWTDGEGVHHFSDTWTNEAGIVEEDANQQIQILSAKKISRGSSPDAIALTITRDVDTCDPEDYVIDTGTTHILYLLDDEKWGKESINGYDVSQTKIKGFNRVQVIKADIDSELPDDVRTFEIRNPEVAIPAEETTYWCTIHRLPEEAVQRKNHIVQTEPIITKENRAVIHHMEVFHCEWEEDQDQRVSDYGGPCTGSSAPEKELEKCRNVIGAWAMGALTFTYPPEAGLAVGEEKRFFRKPKRFSPFVRLEVHFNNPEKLEGHVDSSGLRFFYTPTLRPYDTGIMELGLEYGPKDSIPPRQPEFALSGYCIGECTRTALPAGGIHVFAGQLHTHNYGVKVRTRHIRNGIELPEIARDDHYSTHFQEIRLYPKPINVLPGDDLITTCAYDTRNKSTMVLSGYSIQEEMCVNYIYYYPRSDLELCKSSIDTKALDAYFRLQSKLSGRYRRDLSIAEQHRIQSSYAKIKFDSFETKLLEKIYQMAPISMQCNQSDGAQFPGSWNGKKKPIILQQLTKDRDCPISEPK